MLADVEGLQPAEPPPSAPGHNLGNVSDHDQKSAPGGCPPATAEMVLPESSSPGSDDAVTGGER